MENEIDEINFDYSQQGEILNEILDKIEIIEQYQRLLDKSKQFNPLVKERIEEIEELTINQQQIFDEEEFNKEMVMKFSLKERSQMKYHTLDNYCIFIASRYFKSIDDHINLITVSKRMRGNMEKFHYNPISVDSNCVTMFPNIETLHLYKEEDEYLEGGRIQRYVNWNKVSYHKSKQMKEENIKGKEIEFKIIVWSSDDTTKEINKQKHTNKNNQRINCDYKLFIPEGINEIYEDSFNSINCQCNLKELTISSTIKPIPKKCIEKCWSLTNITLPLNESQIIIGNKIFKNDSQFKEYIKLPDDISVINGKTVYSLNSSFIIPSVFTSLEKNSFQIYSNFVELIIPQSINYIPYSTLSYLKYLINITLPSYFTYKGDKLFFVKDQCLHSVALPVSVKNINGMKKEKDKEILRTFTIPTNVTKLSDYCFANCYVLSKIDGLNKINTFGKGCFYRCLKLNRNKYKKVKINDEEHINDIIKENEIKQLEKWTELSLGDIVFDSEIDNWNQNSSMFDRRIIGKCQLLFLIEDTEGKLYGSFIYSQIKNECNNEIDTDSYSFLFSLRSNKETFNPKKMNDIYHYILFDKNSKYLINFNQELIIGKENHSNESEWFTHKRKYNFKKKRGANESFGSFIPKRITVIQME